MTMLGRIGIEGLRTVNIVMQDTPRDSAKHMTRCAVVAAR